MSYGVIGAPVKHQNHLTKPNYTSEHKLKACA